MTIKRAALVLGGTVILAGASLVMRPGAAAQQPSPAASSTAPVHSVKIALAPSSTDPKYCEVRSLIPETAGVYGSDTLTLHIENGCQTEATVMISDFTRVGETGPPTLYRERTWPAEVTVGPRERRHFEATIVADAEEETIFEYTVTVKRAEPTKPRPGRVFLCRQPPCPSS